MTPPPTRQELIELVEREASGSTPLEQLGAAASTVAELESVGDAVLSHFVDQARHNGHSWSEISGALGVTKQAAHKRYSLTDRFTPRARRVIEQAESVARALGHNFVGTEHLLLAQFEEAESVAAKVLAGLGATREAVAREVLERVPRGTLAAGGALPFTPRAAEMLAATAGLAIELGHNYIGTEHLLLATFVDAEGVAAQVLAALGIDRDQVRARIVEILSGFGAPKR